MWDRSVARVYSQQCDDGGVSSPHQSVPPQVSSHSASGERSDRGSEAGTSRHVIRINRLSLIAVLMLFFCVSFPALGWPAAFGWLIALPIVVAIWILRVQTTLTADGIETRRMFGSGRVQWSQIKGIRFPKRGWARADLVDGGEPKLPAVGFDRLRDLAAASGGRIPDPFASVPEVVDADADANDSGHRAESE